MDSVYTFLVLFSSIFSSLFVLWIFAKIEDFVTNEKILNVMSYAAVPSIVGVPLFIVWYFL